MMLLFLLGVISASPAQAISRIPQSTVSATATADSRNLILAVPASALVGFGLGHHLQARLSGAALTFPIVDAIGYALILASIKDCPGTCSKRGTLNAGLGLVIASRLTQVIDVALFKGAEVAISPSTQRPQILGGIRF